MFKAIWHEKQILIVLLWSRLIFIGYNVLTVEAEESSLHKEAESKQSESDIKNFWRELEQDEVDELCDASEDYEKFKKGCYVAYDSIVTPEEYEKNLEEYELKQSCDEVDGKWKKNGCDINGDEDKAAYEDYVCEEPEDSDRYPKICKAWLFED